ncbi:MAG: hypothetical protein OHK0012_15160 [Synechococcales cyanobacterium]
MPSPILRRMTMLNSITGASPTLETFVCEQLNQVADPCALALGVTIGLEEMGLLKHLDISPNPSGYAIHLTLRLTSPDCLYFIYFEREIRQRLVGQAGIESVTFTWDSCLDWTPAFLSPAAQSALNERRHRQQHLVQSSALQ